MNFPESTKTGALAEISLMRLFTEWSWAVGKDLIDIGYDLTVQPSTSIYSGHRFHVQSKGTASKKKKKISAQVSKARLRDYHKNPHPVFIVRSTGEGQLYWVHAQSWTKENPGRLEGNGYASVSFPKENDLHNRQHFTEFLSEILAPPASKPGAIADLAKERSNYLSELDPRFNVQVEYTSGVTSYLFSAAEQDVQIPVEMTLKDKSGHEQLLDHVNFGTPVNVELKDIKFSGSKLFQEMGMKSGETATLEIEPAVFRKGSVELWAGSQFSHINEKIHVPCQFSFGREGFALKSVPSAGLLACTVRASLGEHREVNVNLSFCAPAFEDTPLRSLTGLRALGTWAEEVLKEQTLALRITAGGKSAPLKKNVGDDNAFGMLDRLVLLAKLHRIACALDLDVVIDPKADFTPDEASSISYAYDLLKGIAAPLNVKAQSFPIDKPFEAPEDRTYIVKTLFGVYMGSRIVCSIPVEALFRDYDHEVDESASTLQLLPNESSSAYVRYKQTDGALEQQT